MRAELVDILHLFDEVLQELGQPGLLKNPLFAQKPHFDSEFYMPFELAQQSSNAIPIWFELSQSGLTFYLDRTNEIPEWDYKTLMDNPEHVKQTIRNILTAWVLVDYKGQKTVLRLFNECGEQINQFTYWQGIRLNFLKSSTFYLYQPILRCP
ncbi:hypothetical protein [Solirubrum puertoriconensis]|uniref:Uncharacterized protein n=1 Tax=Solirubrum puertoriconensis TaxID=1751427 RepID=A0A9X0HNQ7_SOLP1|nr:hypothetical protein [Solirubrum puertoriconensis]KUG09298.1 hypothetical protein ASU33_16290 [Solirubrum puertoriconensis]